MIYSVGNEIRADWPLSHVAHGFVANKQSRLESNAFFESSKTWLMVSKE